MTLFANGKQYATAISLAPPTGQAVPYVEVFMTCPEGLRRPVAGKLDTGAFATMLTFATAQVLGIFDPKSGFLRRSTAYAANGQAFFYYVHRLIVSVSNPSGPDLSFPLEAGFAEELKRNLFGVDWLRHMCVAIDRQKVHLLRD
jgi:hypothetical protein